MKTHLLKQTYEFVHKDIHIWVKVDYLNNLISLVEPWRIEQGTFTKKDWIFAGRGVEYMQGWLNVLEAMGEAIKDAKKKYEANHAEESKFKEEKVVELLYKAEKFKSIKKK